MIVWMLWAIVTGTLLGAAASLLEGVMRAGGRQGRWAWVAAIAGGTVLQAWSLMAWLRPAASDVTGRVDGGGGVLEAWWGSAEGFARARLPDGLETYVGIAWIAVTALLLAGLSGGLWRLRRRATMWSRRQVAGHEVLVSDDFGPAIVGLRSPRIVLPAWVAGLGLETVSIVCRHEAEHRDAADAWLLGAGALLVAVLPWNAALWWQVVRLRAAVELDCDRRVVAAGVTRDAYARVLFRLGASVGRAGISVPAFLQQPTLLERRLTVLIESSGRMGPLGTAASLCVAAALTVAACEAPAPTLAADPEASAEVAPQRAIRIAGATSAPMVLIDGEEVDGRAALDDLDPDAIASIEVIKGPAAARMYGEGAQGGVVQIHLKPDASAAN